MIVCALLWTKQKQNNKDQNFNTERNLKFTTKERENGTSDIGDSNFT